MEELIKLYEKLIYKISNNFYNVEKEDLIQAGKVGLIQAYKHYDNNSDTKFSTYAYSYIFGEMYKLSIKNNSLKINKDTLKLIKLVEKTYNMLSQELKKIPSIKEISNYLKIDEEIIYAALSSTCKMLNIENEENDTYKLYDNDTRIDLNTGISKLDNLEQNVINYRYYHDYTQEQTAQLLNVSQVSVSRYEKKSLNKLKNFISAA